MYRVGVIGHFGVGLDLANGQTIKTKIVTKAIEEEFSEKVKIVDAHGGVKAVIPVVCGCFSSLVKCKNIILMLTENGLKVSVPVLSVLNKVFRRRLHYAVIGGWLPKFLETQHGLEKKLKAFTCIYVETTTMKNALEKKGFRNVSVLPNCKELRIITSKDLVYENNHPLKLCTFSRVMKEKGIEDAVRIVRKINNSAANPVFSLDIYGQIDLQQTEWFNYVKTLFSDNIKYCGVVPFDESVEVLKDYFALLFPTRFYTEGIPGTIIDGYAAGVPVISAKWESYADVVEDEKTGIGYTMGHLDELENILYMAANNPQKINSMKEDCLRKAEEFTIYNALQLLFDNLR